VIRSLVIAAIVAICIGAPIVEIFDQWDQTLQDGNHTEANVVVAALCVGVALAIGTIGVVARIRALASGSRVCVVASPTISFAVTAVRAPLPTSSPPTPLRV
jgi:hypothetical protein